MPLCYLASHACFVSRHREGTIEQRKAKNKLILFVKLIQVVGAFLPTGYGRCYKNDLQPWFDLVSRLSHVERASASATLPAPHA